MCRLTWSNDYLVIVHIIYKRPRKKQQMKMYAKGGRFCQYLG